MSQPASLDWQKHKNKTGRFLWPTVYFDKLIRLHFYTQDLFKAKLNITAS